ncbi:MAG: hypothetical protein Q6L60_05530 [Thermostichus sp. HHBFW_bins_43]
MGSLWRGGASAFLVAALGLCMSGEGWAQSRTFLLRRGQSTLTTGYFVRNEAIWAECDRDCLDVDLKLFDRNNRLVDADELRDDFPVVRAPFDGEFTLEVIMFDCRSSAGCYVVVDSELGF